MQQNWYSLWMSDPSFYDKQISPDLRRIISCTAVTYGGAVEYAFAFKKYREAKGGSEKYDYLRAMTCTTDRVLISDLLNLAFSDYIRIQDINRFFSYISANPTAHPIALDYLVNRWNDIKQLLGKSGGVGGTVSLSGMFRALCNRINTQSQLDKLEKLAIDQEGTIGSSRSAQQGLELARSNVQWIKNSYSDVYIWLSTENGRPPTTTPTTDPTTIPSTNPTTTPPTDPTTIPITTIGTSSTTTSTSTATITTTSASTSTPTSSSPTTPVISSSESTLTTTSVSTSISSVGTTSASTRNNAASEAHLLLILLFLLLLVSF